MKVGAKVYWCDVAFAAGTRINMGDCRMATIIGHGKSEFPKLFRHRLRRD